MSAQLSIVGLLGKAGHGKSTVARYLGDNYSAKEFMFAGPLKEMTKIIWEFSDEQAYGGQAIKEAVDTRWNMSPRTAMQRLGNSARVCIGMDVWVDACLNAIRKDADETGAKRFVISDVRHMNEAARLSTAGIPIIKLQCLDAPPASNPNHPSEAEVDMVPAERLIATIVHSREAGFAPLFTAVDNVIRKQCKWFAF